MNYTYGDKFEDCQNDSIIYIQILDIRKEDGKLDIGIKNEIGYSEEEWSISKFQHGLKTGQYQKIEGLFA